MPPRAAASAVASSPPSSAVAAAAAAGAEGAGAGRRVSTRLRERREAGSEGKRRRTASDSGASSPAEIRTSRRGRPRRRVIEDSDDGEEDGRHASLLDGERDADEEDVEDEEGRDKGRVVARISRVAEQDAPRHATSAGAPSFEVGLTDEEFEPEEIIEDLPLVQEADGIDACDRFLDLEDEDDDGDNDMRMDVGLSPTADGMDVVAPSPVVSDPCASMDTYMPVDAFSIPTLQPMPSMPSLLHDPLSSTPVTDDTLAHARSLLSYLPLPGFPLQPQPQQFNHRRASTCPTPSSSSSTAVPTVHWVEDVSLFSRDGAGRMHSAVGTAPPESPWAYVRAAMDRWMEEADEATGGTNELEENEESYTHAFRPLAFPSLHPSSPTRVPPPKDEQVLCPVDVMPIPDDLDDLVQRVDRASLGGCVFTKRKPGRPRKPDFLKKHITRPARWPPSDLRESKMAFRSPAMAISSAAARPAFVLRGSASEGEDEEDDEDLGDVRVDDDEYVEDVDTDERELGGVRRDVAHGYGTPELSPLTALDLMPAPVAIGVTGTKRAREEASSEPLSPPSSPPADEDVMAVLQGVAVVPGVKRVVQRDHACGVCGRMFTRKADVIRHAKAVHTIGGDVEVLPAGAAATVSMWAGAARPVV
ncbi:hypothetical protein HK101_005565, partial [Irineochytrium annulatum]